MKIEIGGGFFYTKTPDNFERSIRVLTINDRSLFEWSKKKKLLRFDLLFFKVYNKFTP